MACCGLAISILLLGLAFGYALRRSNESGFASLTPLVTFLSLGLIEQRFLGEELCRAVYQKGVGEDEGCHRLDNGDGADSHAWVVLGPLGKGELGGVSLQVEGLPQTVISGKANVHKV